MILYDKYRKMKYCRNYYYYIMGNGLGCKCREKDKDERVETLILEDTHKLKYQKKDGIQ